jgi:hypothetical protein
LRWVAKGFLQQQVIDSNETFSPVVKWTTVRTLTAFAAQKNSSIHL